MLSDIYMTNTVIFAQRVLDALISKALVREEAYETVQPIAMEAYNKGIDYEELLKQSEAVRKHLSEEEIASCFTLDYYFKEVGYIYKRLGLED